MSRARVQDVYELSPMQQGILFQTLLDPAADVYFEQSIVSLSGELDRERFAGAWQRAAERHAVLRTSFHWEGLEKPVQVVHPRVEVPIEVRDWRDTDPEEQRVRLETHLREDRRKGIDLASAPLLRVALFRTGEEAHECVVSFQHLLLDRWSRFLLLKEIVADAAGGSVETNPPRAVDYADYIAWLQSQDRRELEAFWRARLAGFNSPTSLRLVARTIEPGREFLEARSILSREASDAIQGFARREHLTLNTLVQGMWALLLARYTGDDDVLFGATFSGRSAGPAGVESVVGLFINTLPMRVRVAGAVPVKKWLAELQGDLVELTRHEHSSLIDVQGWSEIPRGTPLFDSLVVFENVGVEPDSRETTRVLQIREIRSVGDRSGYPLTLLALPGARFAMKLVGDVAFFDAEAIERMLAHLRNLLEAAAADPDRPLAQLPMLSEAETRRLLFEWNDPSRDFGPTRRLAEVFEAQAAKTPDAIALELDERRMTYRQLDRRANRLAWRLKRMGVGPDALVALCLDRSFEMLVALVAILKAGGAYVPLDPAYPAERLGFMIEDAKARVLVTDESHRALLPAELGPSVCLVDRDAGEIAEESDANPPPVGSSEDLAYVIYTSGSTGKPKGVAVTQANVDRLFTATEAWFHFDSTDVWTLFHSFAFDFSVWEMWGAWRYGGRLVLVPHWVARSPESFYRLLASSGVTVLNQTPSAFRQLIAQDIASERPLESLRFVIFGGETLEPRMLEPWFARHGEDSPRLVNMYGITETTVHVTYQPITRSDARSPASMIGRPIPDLQVYVLDRFAGLAPIGVPGELHVAGAGLARGYLHRPELTRERFIPNPFSRRPGDRLYRTGDVARLGRDGRLEYLGRIDQQVKIRGHRIELGEIETLLAQQPGVAQAVVTAVDEGPGDRRLVAYLETGGGAAPPESELRGALKRALPEYMIPSMFVTVEKLPRTASGKIDRRSLPKAVRGRRMEEEFVAPRTPIEQAVATIWREVLHAESVSLSDNFFELGGHSLIATQAVSRVAEDLGVRISLRRLFEAPTLEAFSLAVAEELAESEGVEETLRLLAEVKALSGEPAGGSGPEAIPEKEGSAGS